MNTKYFLPFLALSALILIIGCISVMTGGNSWMCKEGIWVKRGILASSMPTVPCNSTNIKVNNLKLNQEVTFPFTVSGEARVFENQFNYRIKDSTGKTLKEGTVYAKAKDVGEFGAFEIKVTSLKTTDTKIVFELFDKSAKDGSEIDKVIVPLQLKSSK